MDVEEVSLQRDRAIAVSEYAPGNSIYYHGGRYQVSEARLKLRNGRPVTKNLLICPKCKTYYMDDEITTTGGACTCGASLQDQQSIKNASLSMPDQFAIRRHGITSDEEERRRLGLQHERALSQRIESEPLGYPRWQGEDSRTLL